MMGFGRVPFWVGCYSDGPSMLKPWNKSFSSFNFAQPGTSLGDVERRALDPPTHHNQSLVLVQKAGRSI